MLAGHIAHLKRRGLMVRYAVDPASLPLVHAPNQDAHNRAQATYLQALLAGLPGGVAAAADYAPQTQGDYASVRGGDVSHSDRLLETLVKHLKALGWGKDSTLDPLKAGHSQLARMFSGGVEHPLTQAFLPGSWIATEADAALKDRLHRSDEADEPSINFPWAHKYGGDALNTARNVAGYLQQAGHGEAAELFHHLLQRGLATGSLPHLLAAHHLLLGHQATFSTGPRGTLRRVTHGYGKIQPHYEAGEVLRSLSPLINHNRLVREFLAGREHEAGQSDIRPTETTAEDYYHLSRRGLHSRF